MRQLITPRRLLVGLFAAAMVCSMSTIVSAQVTGGRCDNCHTMHNSQGGTAMATGGPYPQLLVVTAGCLGCHASGADNSNLSGNDGPQVALAAGGPPAGGTLAGGYFSNQGASATTHDVLGISTGDGTLLNVPPGNGGTALASQLDCTGTVGCHGAGGHHNNNDRTIPTWLDGTGTIGNSFRFLSGGIAGYEDSDWERTNASNDHNIYGGDFPSGGAATDTINALCAQCHGDFHGAANQFTTAWIRHPTDNRIAAAGGEYTAYTVYNVEVPVGTTATNTVPFTDPQGATEGYVLCVSCHKAHGSANADNLRWDYAGMTAHSTAVPGTGCFRCHSNKD